MNYYFNYKMKIAYLISVYKDPQQFVRMLKALRGKETYFFIHVDAKKSEERRVEIECVITCASPSFTYH